MSRADADTLEAELFETIGIDKLIEIVKRINEKELRFPWIAVFLKLTPI